MKKILILLLLTIPFQFTSVKSQDLVPVKGTVIKPIHHLQKSALQLNEGEIIIFNGFSTIYIYNKDVDAIQITDESGKIIYVDDKDIDKIDFNPPSTKEELWQISLLKSDFYPTIAKQGFQYDLRKELDEESNEFIDILRRNDFFFNDEYLEDYIQTLLYKVHSITLNDKRPGNLNIKILRNNTPNAFCLPNGTIVINTGLLSIINTEEELLGILAHEVAHFVLDHQVVNITAKATREKRAVFWTGVATVMAAATEAYLSSEYDINTGGAITLSTAIISSSVATALTERLGVKYSQEQVS